MASRPGATPRQRFWRHAAAPYLEARAVSDGRGICYETHTHETFSVGLITGGRSTYVKGRLRAEVETGAVVIVNPEEPHVCNPVAGEPWSYRMLYVDPQWLGRLQEEIGFGAGGFRAIETGLTRDEGVRSAFTALCRVLDEAEDDVLPVQSAAVELFTRLHQGLGGVTPAEGPASARLSRAAEYMNDNFAEAMTLDDLCAAAGLSPSYFIRAFTRQYGVTPHAYLINRRIQYGRSQLRRGRPIAKVALEAGFADQAHFHRTFKRLVAATPGQYRGRA